MDKQFNSSMKQLNQASTTLAYSLATFIQNQNVQKPPEQLTLT